MDAPEDKKTVLYGPTRLEETRSNPGQGEALRFVRERISLLLANSRFRAALAAMANRDRYGYGGLTPETATSPTATLIDILPVLVVVALAKEPKREAWEKFWTSGTWKTWKALTTFPGRLRGMAEEVERVNGSHFFGPERAITSKTPIAVYAKGQFLRLPLTLRRYADWMEGWTKTIPSLSERAFPPQPRGHSAFLGYISAMTKAITGKYCDREVADILNEADLVLNPSEAKGGPRFSAQTLADLRSRQKRKTCKT